MPKKKHYARIAITLPERDLAAADKLAADLDRSRSWVIAEAVRRFASGEEPPGAPKSIAASAAPAPSAAAPMSASAAAPATTESLTEQLKRDMALTVDQRVLAAEQALDATRRAQKGPVVPRVIAFDRYDEFLDHKRRRDAGL